MHVTLPPNLAGLRGGLSDWPGGTRAAGRQRSRVPGQSAHRTGTSVRKGTCTVVLLAVRFSPQGGPLPLWQIIRRGPLRRSFSTVVPAPPMNDRQSTSLLLVGRFRISSAFFLPGTNARHANQVLNSFGLGYRLVGTPAFKERALVAAKSLYDFRYEVGGARRR